MSFAINSELQWPADPVFLKDFGVETDTCFTPSMSIDPSCSERVKDAWLEYKRIYTAKPSDKQKQMAKKFNYAINRKDPIGSDVRSFEVKWFSPVQGYGVFARRKFENDDVVGLYAGLLTDKPESLDYALEFSDELYEGLSIDATRMGNATRFFNHTSEELANVKPVEYIYKGCPYILMVAKKAIEVEDQFLWNYGDSYWQNHTVQPRAIYP